jgi:hypothetical protein
MSYYRESVEYFKRQMHDCKLSGDMEGYELAKTLRRFWQRKITEARKMERLAAGI